MSVAAAPNNNNMPPAANATAGVDAKLASAGGCCAAGTPCTDKKCDTGATKDASSEKKHVDAQKPSRDCMGGMKEFPASAAEFLPYLTTWYSSADEAEEATGTGKSATEDADDPAGKSAAEDADDTASVASTKASAGDAASESGKSAAEGEEEEEGEQNEADSSDEEEEEGEHWGWTAARYCGMGLITLAILFDEME